MCSFQIGISGLHSAQKAFDIIGNNIANANTEGFHKQAIDLRAAPEYYRGGVMVGQGVDMAGITRYRDSLLEEQILKQDSSLWQYSHELESLQSLESVFGELNSSGLSSAMDQYFNSLEELSADPNSGVLQNQVLTAAESLTYEFRRMGTYMSDVERNLYLEAESTTLDINNNLDLIAELNKGIQRLESRGGQANNLRDNRDAAIGELSRLIGIQVQENDSMVNLYVNGVPLVMGSDVTHLSSTQKIIDDEVQLGVKIGDNELLLTDISGGKMGALLNLSNNTMSQIHSDFDELANSIIIQTNKAHVQGVGSSGSFTGLSGWKIPSSDLTELDQPVVAGTTYIRVNNSAGDVERYAIDIDPAVDTMSSVAAKIAAIPGLGGTAIANEKLHIIADSGYTFDFRGGALEAVGAPLAPATALSSGSDFSVPLVSGAYTGTANENYTGTVVTGGEIGVSSGPKVEIRNSAGELISSYKLGDNYVSGDRLNIEDGLQVRFSGGDMVAGESFVIQALADSDETNFLAATGINCFFGGNDAASMGVKEDVRSESGRVAIAGDYEGTDHSVVKKMAEIASAPISQLGDLSPVEYYQGLASSIGQQVSVTEMQYDNGNSIMRHLLEQKDQISGVDINDEATKMLVYEQMYQAMAKYMSTVADTLKILSSIVN